MEEHKLLKKQLEKHFGEHPPDSKEFRAFIRAVNDSYEGFEQDKKLAQHAFDVASEEYDEMNRRLVGEISQREESIKKLLDAIAILDDTNSKYWQKHGNSLVAVADYLNSQIKLRKQIESRLKNAMEAARKASMAKSEFLSTMSHEIRSPLNTIIGITHILMNDPHHDFQKENFEVLDIASRNLMLLINDILDYNKIESGKLELEETSFDLRSLLTNIKKANAPLAAEKGNKLKLNIDDRIPEMVLGDSVRLGQIVTNLVNNAVKFTKEGNIEIEVSFAGKRKSSNVIRFVVKDDGIGIDPSDQKKIFESFSQANAGTLRQYGGTGLGLSISKKLLDLMRSEIYVESAKDKGATFYFELEMKTGQKVVPATTSDLLHKNLSNASILVVDDIEYNVTILRKIIERWNIRLDVASNGKEAIQKIRSNDYKLVLMDLHMPVMGGKEAARKIRAFNKQLPIIALTASSNEETLKEVLASGMNDYVTKPFFPDDLYRKLKTLIPQK